MQKDVFIIVGTARAGTTSLCKILSMANNAVCLLEPPPNLHVESRMMIEGRLHDPFSAIELLRPRIEESHSRGLIHGEKNVPLLPFVSYLHITYGAKIIYMYRDAREVVTSLLNWHNCLFGTIYRECADISEISETAFCQAAALPLDMDLSDFGRPRPLKGDKYYSEWMNFSRAEMCAWYWSFVNTMALDLLERLPRESKIYLDYSAPKVQNIMQVVDFLELTGINQTAVASMLNKGINSLQDRTGELGTTPPWQEWPEDKRNKVMRIVEPTMNRLGYGEPFHPMPKPVLYGSWWCNRATDLEWYQEIYSGRQAAHDAFLSWLKRVESREGTLSSILDVGCGLGVGYSDHFADRRYVGMDIASQAVEWCRINRNNPRHNYISGDLIRDCIGEKFDLVFSQGSIDNVYDMDAFLAAMVRASRRWIYVSAYRGWFPNLDTHVYSWSDQTTCFYNDISPNAVEHTLTRLGCIDIQIVPKIAGKDDIKHETVIIARVPGA